MDNKKRIRDLTNTSVAPENTDFLVLDNGTTNKITRANLLSGTPLPADTVDTQAIENDAVTEVKIAADSVGGSELKNTSLGNKIFARLAVNGVEISSIRAISVACASDVRSLVSEVSGGSTSSRNHIAFVNSNGVVGQISTSGTSTTYTTSSDYRLKEDYKDVVDPFSIIEQIKVRDFKWKADGKRTIGFIAHEVQAVVPDAVSGKKDAVDAEGNPEPQMVDYSKFVPLLTAALQEANDRIKSLEQKVIALEK